jgi:hypothetical protein
MLLQYPTLMKFYSKVDEVSGIKEYLTGGSQVFKGVARGDRGSWKGAHMLWGMLVPSPCTAGCLDTA